MKIRHKEYEIDDSVERVDFGAVHGWLTTAYWSVGITRDEIIRGAAGSGSVVGCYGPDGQTGYLRVISDEIRFAYFADVFVDERCRGRGMARAMMRFALELPKYKGVCTWLLATEDTRVYEGLGFKTLEKPEKWMMLQRPISIKIHKAAKPHTVK
jgi:GNAT superfamily N-acetyltransferase